MVAGKVNIREQQLLAVKTKHIYAVQSRRTGVILFFKMALEGCVGSLRSSMQLLDSSINILDEATNDFPRLSKVLQTTRVGPTC